jgi:hypothetical protein
MAPFGSTYTNSPVLAMPPQPAHQGPFGGPVLPHQSLSFGHSASWSQTPTRSPHAIAGRKRSRDEAAVNLDPPEKIVEPPVIKESEEEWIYGPGMTLIKRTTGYVADASSQSGTWVEEKAAEKEAQMAEAALIAQEQLSQERPSLRSHKSQRLGMTPALSPADGFHSNRSSPIRDVVNPMTASSDSIAQPVVDDFTVHLGIGWSRISDDEHIQAAARGWARYIENHYPVTDPKIRLESRGLQSYLVEADEGFFLFAENLRQGRLVSSDVERTLQNLKTSPPTFDGPHTMDAAESPKPVELAPEAALAIAPTAPIDMDMC